MQNGRPGAGDVPPRLGGYKPWREMVGGILNTAGFIGFLGNLEEMYTEMDVDGTQWDAFITRWYEKWKSEPKTAVDIINQIKIERDSTDPAYADPLSISECLPDDIADAIADRKGSPSKKVGNAIRKKKDRIFCGGLGLFKKGQYNRSTLWVVKPTGNQAHKTHTKSDQNYELDEFYEFWTDSNAGEKKSTLLCDTQIDISQSNPHVTHKTHIQQPLPATGGHPS